MISFNQCRSRSFFLLFLNPKKLECRCCCCHEVEKKNQVALESWIEQNCFFQLRSQHSLFLDSYFVFFDSLLVRVDYLYFSTSHTEIVLSTHQKRNTRTSVKENSKKSWNYLRWKDFQISKCKKLTLFSGTDCCLLVISVFYLV